MEELTDELKEVNVEYVYLTIPAKYVCIYQRLLVYLADLGKQQIDDCNATCKGNGKNIITCWNLFQSAIACHNLQQYKEAEFFIDYIKKQIDNIYIGEDKIPFNNTIPLPITGDGLLKAYVGCGDTTKFYVDAKTGKLYESKDSNVDINRTYEINNYNLINKINE